MLTFHGLTPWTLDCSSGTLTIACLWAEDHQKYKTEQDAFLYLAINAHWEDHVFKLPIIPAGLTWQLEASSSQDSRITESGEAFVTARSVMLLTGEPVR